MTTTAFRALVDKACEIAENLRTGKGIEVSV
jgi:hypothetical protein